ncbi:MAG: HAMP domain-containing protein [Chloroflexi bacterium SZAS-1]|nr:HAMP domain-containing protein [Chloroflexi bacterium SZAS-1]
MRSLTIKLTLAFLLVGALGASLVAVLVGLRTRTEFDRFISERDQNTLVQALEGYYTAHNSWDGVNTMLADTPPLDFYSRSLKLIDIQGKLLLDDGKTGSTAALPPDWRKTSTSIEVNDQVVGYALFPQTTPAQSRSANQLPPDVQFLNRVTDAALVSAGIAALLALLLGVLLARTLTRSLRELTLATEAMARGNLNQRVVVRSRDEIGELAQSFNQMSADLARSSQLRKQMTADLAHDLRTPLSILRGYTEGLQDGRLQGAPRLYTIMHGEVEHLQRLVDDLRVLSLADAGELPINRRAVDPAALLERTGLAYIVKAEEQGLELRVEAAEDLPSVEVDTDRITQVLNNLVSNAMRYTSQGAIVLAAHADAQRVYLEVRDTGSGIAAEDLPFIFDRFYRADKARQRSTADTSSGLGLAITKAIVEAHGGTIAATSTEGGGTTFTIALPREKAAGTPRQLSDGSNARQPAEQLTRV